MLRFVMPILRKAAIQINFYFSRFSKATSGKIYVALFNFRAILCRQEVRFNLKKKGYLATERQYFRYFVEEEQDWNTYSRGLISRSQRIGRDYFLDRILFSKDDLIVDCGANVGDLYLYFQINKIPIRYIGIEPSTHEFNCLQLNVSNQECYNFGLWNMSGNLPFYLAYALNSIGGNVIFINEESVIRGSIAKEAFYQDYSDGGNTSFYCLLIYSK